MNRTTSRPSRLLLPRRPAAILALAAAFAAGCGSVPAPPEKAPGAALGATLGRQHARADLGDGIVLDYEIVRQTSKIRAGACYGFLSGTLKNASPRTLSRRSVLDVIVSGGGQRLFRDLTNPVADVPPNGSAAIVLVSSPVHRGECPDYDNVSVTLRRVYVAQ